MSLQVPVRPATPEPPLPSRPRRRLPRVPRLLVLGLVLLVVAAVSLKHRAEDAVDRAPLRASARAAQATSQPIRATTSKLAERWSSGNGPRESDLVSRLGPGNGFLATAFYATYHSTLDTPDLATQRCYFIAVTDDGTFAVDRVTELGRLCYADGSQFPMSLAYQAVGRD